MKTSIEGFIRTLSPVHQTRPGVDGYVDRTANGRLFVTFTKKRQGQCNAMMVTPVFDESGHRGEIPMVTGNSLRGVIRRHASRILFTRLKQPVRVELFQCITVGSAHRSDMGGARTAEMFSVAAEHIFVGLFGGGGASLSSHYTMGDLIPITELTKHLVQPWVKDAAGVIGRVAVGEEGSREEYDQRLTHVYATIKRDPLLDGEGVQFVHDHDAAFMTAQGNALKATKAKKAKAAGEETEENPDENKGLRMMSYVEAMIPGLALNFSMHFRPQMKPYHIGFMLMALQDWANDQRLAGASRRGFGRFEPKLKLMDADAGTAIDVFTPQVENGSVSGYAINSELASYLEAADQELDKLSIPILEDLMVSSKAA